MALSMAITSSLELRMWEYDIINMLKSFAIDLMVVDREHLFVFHMIL